MGDIYLALNAAGCAQIIYLCLALPSLAVQTCFCGKLHFSLEISIYMFQQNNVSMEIFSQREKEEKKTMMPCGLG